MDADQRERVARFLSGLNAVPSAEKWRYGAIEFGKIANIDGIISELERAEWNGEKIEPTELAGRPIGGVFPLASDVETLSNGIYRIHSANFCVVCISKGILRQKFAWDIFDGHRDDLS